MSDVRAGDRRRRWRGSTDRTAISPAGGASCRLIENQHWRAAHFRVAADDINYRRFFNINDLAGLRMELPEVFDHAHRLVFRLIADGALDGLRIDHIDGLLDPKAYLSRLREAAPRRDFYLVVEKILAAHEALREDWPVEGTTGYDFANLVLGFLVDPAGELALTEAYERVYRRSAGVFRGRAAMRSCASWKTRWRAN